MVTENGREQNKPYFADTEQEVRFITAVLNLPVGASLLDLYCGYGRHAVALAKMGFQVTGIDASAPFLEIARKKAAAENVSVVFQHCDMRHLTFHDRFDAVINMFAAFGYYTDDENRLVISLVAKALHHHGLFLIDLLNRDWMVRNNLNRYWRHPSGEYVLSYKVEMQDGITRMKRTLLNVETREKITYDFSLRAYSCVEMTTMLQQNGFRIRQVYGGFDGQPYGPQTPRMIILAQKNGEG